MPPDDPEAIFLALRDVLPGLVERYPKARLVFDYTGGTKSMTSALFQAALSMPGAGLQFMAGRRDTLDRVADGSERATAIAVDWLLAERTEARLRQAWERFAYADCADGIRDLLDNLGTDDKAPARVRERLCDLGAAAAAFDAWDRFDHEDAARRLASLALRHPSLEPFAELSRRVETCEGARLVDLFRNAERAAARGRFDDAVARCYRLIEWTVQWHLRRAFRIDTGAMDWDSTYLTDDVVSAAGLRELRQRQRESATPNKTLGGLAQTLALACAIEPEGALARFDRSPYPDSKHRTCAKRRAYVLGKRNHSILAHGARPLGPEDWDKFRAFMAHWNEHLLHPLLREAGIDPSPRQLPQIPPAGL